MILKFCSWPSKAKEEHKIADAVLRCCPCIFRCRKSVGVDNDDVDEGAASISTVITTATTPVIALRLNRNGDTVYVDVHRLLDDGSRRSFFVEGKIIVQFVENIK